MSLVLGVSEKAKIREQLSSLALEKIQLTNKQSTLADIMRKYASGQPLTFAGSSFTADSELACLDMAMGDDLASYASLQSSAFLGVELGKAYERGEFPSEPNQLTSQLAYKKAWQERLDNWWKSMAAQIERRIQMQLDEVNRKYQLCEQRMNMAEQQEKKGIQEFGKLITT